MPGPLLSHTRQVAAISFSNNLADGLTYAKDQVSMILPGVMGSSWMRFPVALQMVETEHSESPLYRE